MASGPRTPNDMNNIERLKAEIRTFIDQHLLIKSDLDRTPRESVLLETANTFLALLVQYQAHTAGNPTAAADEAMERMLRAYLALQGKQ